MTEQKLQPVESHEGIATIRRHENCRDWNGITYRTGMSAKNVGAQSLSMNVATIPPGGVARAHIHVGFEVMLYILEGRVRHKFGPGLKDSVDNAGGDFIYIEPGVPHEVYNLSSTEPGWRWSPGRTPPNGSISSTMTRTAAKNPAFEVRHSKIHGRGVWATKPIRKGTWLIEYTGERISHAEADRRYEDGGIGMHHTFLFVLDITTCIDAAVGGNESRFINHSCDPNCETVYAAGDGEIWVVALRNIVAGEELTYDYGYRLDDESIDEAVGRYPCYCGTDKCRGTILRLDKTG